MLREFVFIKDNGFRYIYNEKKYLLKLKNKSKIKKKFFI